MVSEANETGQRPAPDAERDKQNKGTNNQDGSLERPRQTPFFGSFSKKSKAQPLFGFMIVPTAKASKTTTMMMTGRPSRTARGIYKSESHGCDVEKYTTDSSPT